MRLPNGYGSVKKLSGKRRRPWIVEKTICWETNFKTGKIKQKKQIIGYFATKKDALEALAAFNTNPYDLTNDTITLEDCYNKWSDRKYEKIADKTVTSYKAAWKHLLPLANVPIKQIKTDALQQIIDTCKRSSATQLNIKCVMNGCFEYAMQNDIIDRNYSHFVKVEYTEAVINRIPYSHEEINKLWELVHTDNLLSAKILLILLYTGMRVNELLKMPHECCDLRERFLNIKHSKTKAGIRMVPIHDNIFPLIKEFYDKNKPTLIVNDTGAIVRYNNFVARDYKKLNELIKTEHHLHDTRHTFISQAKELNLDSVYIKKIVGHELDSVTEKVYTHVPFATLRSEINKLHY